MSHTLLRDLHQAAANLEAAVVTQHVWGVRPGHRDELILRDRATGAGTSSGSDEPLDERLWCLMDYYDPTAIVDTEGEVVERYRFSAFGLRAILDPDFDPRAASLYDWDFAFKGQFLDLESGYYNYGYRYYSPELGRWLSRDPIGERGGVNLYAMAGNDAVNNHDYLGLTEKCEGPDDVGNIRVTACELTWTSGLSPLITELAKEVFKKVGGRFGVPGAISASSLTAFIAGLQAGVSTIGPTLEAYYRPRQEKCEKKCRFFFFTSYEWVPDVQTWIYSGTWLLYEASIQGPSYTQAFLDDLDAAIANCQ
jgi:RHS repeat-associated protein